MADVHVDVDLDLLDGDLERRIEALRLDSNIADLTLKGWTIIENAAPPALIEGLRERILALAAEDQAAGVARKNTNMNAFSDQVYLLPGRGRVFEEALCNPKLVTLNEFLLGKGFQLQTCIASIRSQGVGLGGLHSDQSAVRPPYPPYCLLAPSVWCLDDWTDEGGATRFVSGSHRWLRPPTEAELETTPTVPAEAPKGSVLFWHGSTWNRAGARTMPGTRVGMHSPHSRSFLKVMDSYDDIPDDVIDRNPPVFARMLGREDPFGKTTIEGFELAGIEQQRAWVDT